MRLPHSIRAHVHSTAVIHLAMLALIVSRAPAAEVAVSTRDELVAAMSAAVPGTTISIAPGIYAGDIYVDDVHGSAGSPVVIRASDPADKPLFSGGSEAFHISDAAYVEFRDLAFTGQGYQAINIDDGGTYDTPAHHVSFTRLDIHDVGTIAGITNGIKISGLDDFTVQDCVIANWGSAGDGIDMVGCHRGLIQRSTFSAGDHSTSHAFQTKGGSRDILIRHCRFEHSGERAFQIGGSTGLAYFRPSSDVGYEAKDITAEYNVIIGSEAAVAFVGVDGAVFRFNTIWCPTTWIMRILQETTVAGFAPCRNVVVTDNIIAFRSDVQTTCNIGSDTAPETFSFARNWWYCVDAPGSSTPSLPIAETGGHLGIDPQFVNATIDDLHLSPGSPAANAGAYAPDAGSGTSGSDTSGATGSSGTTGSGSTAGAGSSATGPGTGSPLTSTGGGSGGGASNQCGMGAALAAGAALALATLLPWRRRPV